MKPVIWLPALMLLCGCEQQIRLGVEQTVSTIPDILTDNVVNNLLRIKKNRNAVIAQVALKESVSTAINGFNYGVAPYIALRAVGITGISATANNSLNENWSASPVNGSLDQYRLQLLFRHAVRGDVADPKHFQSVRKALLNAGYAGLRNVDRPKLQDAFSFLPDLPPGPFAEVDASCLESGDHPVRGTLSLHTVCFHKVGDISGQEVASLLVLWAVAIPDMSSAINQPGASTRGGSNLVIAAPR